MDGGGAQRHSYNASAPWLYTGRNLEQRQINQENLNNNNSNKKKKHMRDSSAEKKIRQPKKEQQPCARYSGNEPWRSFNLALKRLNTISQIQIRKFELFIVYVDTNQRDKQ